MKKITRKDIFQHLAIVFGILLFLYINRYVKKIDNEILNKNIRTVGYLYDIGHDVKVSNYVFRFYYFIDGVKYQGVDTRDSYKCSLDTIQEGSFYEIVYHPKKKQYSEIDLGKKVSVDSICNYFEGDCPFKRFP